MKYSLFLGRVLGIRIYLHWTFLILILVIIISGLNRGLSVEDVMWTVALVLSVFACVVFHELGHSLMARKFGVDTKQINLLPIGGVAQLDKIPEKPQHELLISIAGPAVNIAIAVLLLPFIDIHSLLQSPPLESPNSANFVFTLAAINIWLAAFNMVPAFPMDGGRALRACLAFWLTYGTATKIAAYVGQFFAIVFFILGMVYSPMLMLIALFVLISGQSESAAAQASELMRNYTVEDVLMKDVPTIESSATLGLATEKLLGSQNKNFIVIEGNNAVGTLTRDEILNAAKQNDDETAVSKIRTPRLSIVPHTMPLAVAWEIMQAENCPVVLIGSKDNIEGILDMDNIVEFLALKSARKKPSRSRRKIHAAGDAGHSKAEAN